MSEEQNNQSQKQKEEQKTTSQTEAEEIKEGQTDKSMSQAARFI